MAGIITEKKRVPLGLRIDWHYVQLVIDEMDPDESLNLSQTQLEAANQVGSRLHALATTETVCPPIENPHLIVVEKREEGRLLIAKQKMARHILCPYNPLILPYKITGDHNTKGVLCWFGGPYCRYAHGVYELAPPPTNCHCTKKCKMPDNCPYFHPLLEEPYQWFLRGGGINAGGSEYRLWLNAATLALANDERGKRENLENLFVDFCTMANNINNCIRRLFSDEKFINADEKTRDKRFETAMNASMQKIKNDFGPDRKEFEHHGWRDMLVSLPSKLGMVSKPESEPGRL